LDSLPGSHTGEADIQLIVEPVLMEPLRRRRHSASSYGTAYSWIKAGTAIDASLVGCRKSRGHRIWCLHSHVRIALALEVEQAGNRESHILHQRIAIAPMNLSAD
jgi:hypothetical protein